MSIDSSTACARCEPPMKFCICGVRHEVQRLIDYYSSEAAETMRAACIAAVEALPPFHNAALLHKVEDVLAALREVQP